MTTQERVRAAMDFKQPDRIPVFDQFWEYRQEWEQAFGLAKSLTEALGALYDAFPTCDFSRDVLERMAERLAVVAAQPCGWTDIGTPDRLGRVFVAHPGVARMAS